MPSCNVPMINCGSSSTKFALVSETRSLFSLYGLAERPGSRDAVLRWRRGGDNDSLMAPNADHRTTLAQLLPVAQNAMDGKLYGIDHRMVHDGELFTHVTRIDDRVVEAIQAIAPLAPLYSPANLQGIEVATTLFPKLPHVAVPDTAFHQSLPEYVYHYALPKALYREHGVRCYGFRGASRRYISRHAVEMAGLAVSDSSWFSAHLGDGSSTCAIVNGQSLDISMGLTPLEDLVMDTRSDDVDPSLHSHPVQTLGWGLERIDSILNNENGLLGLSDLPNDMRILEQECRQGHPGAALAIEVFCYRLAKPPAAMNCALPQLDGVIFTGSIGENSSLVCTKTAIHLRLFDLRLDREANTRCMHDVAGPIQTAGYPWALVISANEERQIALDTLALLN